MIVASVRVSDSELSCPVVVHCVEFTGRDAYNTIKLWLITLFLFGC